MKEKCYFEKPDANDILYLYKTNYNTIYATDTITNKEVAIADILRTEQDSYFICVTENGEPVLRYTHQLINPCQYI